MPWHGKRSASIARHYDHTLGQLLSLHRPPQNRTDIHRLVEGAGRIKNYHKSTVELGTPSTLI